MDFSRFYNAAKKQLFSIEIGDNVSWARREGLTVDHTTRIFDQIKFSFSNEVVADDFASLASLFVHAGSLSFTAGQPDVVWQSLFAYAGYAFLKDGQISLARIYSVLAADMVLQEKVLAGGASGTSTESVVALEILLGIRNTSQLALPEQVLVDMWQLGDWSFSDTDLLSLLVNESRDKLQQQKGFVVQILNAIAKNWHHNEKWYRLAHPDQYPEFEPGLCAVCRLVLGGMEPKNFSDFAYLFFGPAFGSAHPNIRDLILRETVGF